jgi:hypothetical protein
VILYFLIVGRWKLHHLILEWDWQRWAGYRVAPALVGRELTFLHETLQTVWVLASVGANPALIGKNIKIHVKSTRQQRASRLTYVTPQVATKVCLMSECSGAASEIAFEWLKRKKFRFSSGQSQNSSLTCSPVWIRT